MRTVVLSGPPGAGKTTIGARLAAALGLPFVDTDELVAARAGGQPPGAILRERGEPAFRALEADVVRELLSSEVARVVACGGGTLVDRALRHFALDRALVVSLGAREAILRARLAAGPDRPLAGEGGARLATLLEQRAPAYAEAHVTVATDELDLDEAADAILPWLERPLVAMPLGLRSYTVEIARHDPTRVIDRLAAMAPSSIVTVTDARVRRSQGKLLESMLAPLTVPRVDVVLAPGESQKNLGSVAAIWDAALGANVDRDAVVFAFGGGVVLDLAGFAAATLLRGVRWAAAPTTVLSMLDASVGGKTGFDHASGKNLIGAFHQPSAVVAELATLATLPDRERRAGLAEAVKIALTCDAALFERIDASAEALAAGDEGALLPVVHAAVAAKARIVRDDEHERGDRVLLNFGHTVGHALEAHGQFAKWLHGEAVALGLVAELRAGASLGVTPAALVGRASRLLARLGLPSEVAPGELAASLPWMASDKKRRRGHLRLPLVTEVGEARIHDVAPDRFTAAVAPPR